MMSSRPDSAAVALTPSSRAGVDGAIARAQTRARRLQHEAGHWHAPLEANVGMDAQYVIFNRFMGRRPETLERPVMEGVLALQSDDGSWPLYAGGPGHLSTTIEAYFALKLTGHDADLPALRRARDFVLAHGGLARAGVFTRGFLAYFGEFPWRGLPAMPVELTLLPPWCPINIYALSSWARATVVPMTVLMAKRPHVPLAADERLGELWHGSPAVADLRFPRGERLVSWANAFLALDRALHAIGRIPWKPWRRRALAQAERWILAHQDPDGGWGGIQPPMINSVMALRALGHSNDHPAVARGIRAIDDFLIDAGGRLFFQPCISPTWDTALMVRALLDSGVPGDDPALVCAAEWLIAHQIFAPGDWSIYNPDLAPGGWAFEYTNDRYPDVDDSAVILMALRDVVVPEHARKEKAVRAGLAWTLGMQSRNGGWAAFDTDNDAQFLNEIPFADMKAMIDPPTEDLTGRVLELMGTYRIAAEHDRARRAREFLLRTQRPDGAWWGRWGANFIYGTWSALAGLAAAGEPPDAPCMRRAVAWLESRQNADGGWGETMASYDDEQLAGRGVSTPSQTAWAMMGLLAGQAGIGPALERGAAYLVGSQREDGGWDEEPFTGTGFPGHFYLRYWMYRDYFPLMALGQLRARMGAEDPGGQR